MRFNQLRIYLNILILATLFLQGCVPIKPAEQETYQLKVLLLPFLSFAPYFIADAEGYFTEQGLEIEYIKMEGSAQAVPALIQGDIDVVGGVMGISMLSAMGRDAEISFVADKGFLDPDQCTSSGFLASKSLLEAGALTSPADLKGQNISLDATQVEGYFLETLLQPFDLSLADVETDDLPAPVLSEALADGAMAVIHTSEPWITRIENTGAGELWFPSDEIVPDFQFAVITYGPNLLVNNPEAGQRFMVAYLKAVQQYNQGKTNRNLEILSEATGLDAELLEQTCWPAMHNDGSINVQSVNDFQQWALDKGHLDELVPVERFWNSSFVEYAVEQLKP